MMRKLAVILLSVSRYLPHLLPTETSGIPGVTQAEIIITLGTLGIIAMNTLPGFVTDQQRNCIIMQLKRDYAVYSSGMSQAINENGTPDSWGTNGSTGLADINNVLSRYFKVIKDCDTDAGCFPNVNYTNLKGNADNMQIDQDPQYTKFRLIDGEAMAINLSSSNCTDNWGDTLQLQNVCGTLLIDVNGDKNPNAYGKDLFGFAITKYGLIPLGSAAQNNAYPFSAFCSTTSNANFKYENGLSCTAWAMTNQNMDYLDCKGLNWQNGKTTCKAP